MHGRFGPMTVLWLAVLLASLATTARVHSQTQDGAHTPARASDAVGTECTVAIVWDGGEPEGRIEVANGRLASMRVTGGDGRASGGAFSFRRSERPRLEVTVTDANLGRGPEPAMLTVWTEHEPFTVLLRDVSDDWPVLIRDYGVAVTTAGDARAYRDIDSDILARGLRKALDRIGDMPEESFDTAAAHTRDQKVPTLLGLGRDMRLFMVQFGTPGTPAWYGPLNYSSVGEILPRNSFRRVTIPETNDAPTHYQFVVGRGEGVEAAVTRRLEDGVLPILHTTVVDGKVTYDTVCYASMERSSLTPSTLKGTHFLIADENSAGFMQTKPQKAMTDAVRDAWTDRDEEVVLYFRATATNTGSVPSRAWFKTPSINTGYEFESDTGFSRLPSGRVFCVSKLDGGPLPMEEIAVLLAPGESARFEFCLPHTPIAGERAVALASRDYDHVRAECRDFWRERLSRAARVELPDTRIGEMMMAGLLQLDILTFGLEPDGTLAPVIGNYAPIGSESAPIIQFMESMGWEDTARRAADYFLDKQHEDGFIQNFGGYMLETGAALWTLGELYRHTGDTDRVRDIAPKLVLSCDYLIAWRERNMDEGLRGRGYGMIDGKVADPEDPYYSYMLNGYAYLGLARSAEMLRAIDHPDAERIALAAGDFKSDIRDSYFLGVARSPAVPLGDGTWCPTSPPWPGPAGPLMLFTEPERIFSHGTFTARDAMLGPHYLVFQEVLDPEGPAAGHLLDYHAEMMYQHNAAYSQPYYSRHAWIELRRGLVKPFLATFFNTVAAIADRETYTFWEHLYHVSPHKTHETAWFLMQTRWMLWMEVGDDLRLLPGIPRDWLADGRPIVIEGAKSYFGELNVEVVPDMERDIVTATVSGMWHRTPERIMLRIPHPEGRLPRTVEGGVYDAASESVVIEGTGRPVTVRLEY